VRPTSIAFNRVSQVGARACQRIGHGGASALAPGNTLQSFDAALEVGIDMVEFDVRRWRGELVLAHTILHASAGRSVRLQDALAHLASRRFRDVGLNVDVKHVGCERALLDELERAHLLQRTLLSSQVPAALDRLRELEPQAQVGISIGGWLPRVSHRWSDWRARVLAGLATRRWDVLMVQYGLVDSHLLEAVEDRSGLLYAWTVNDRVSIQSLLGLGVHGIATADPRLFAPN
jgi:glycerophosphoryl diester phosphodiesterase